MYYLKTLTIFSNYGILATYMKQFFLTKAFGFTFYCNIFEAAFSKLAFKITDIYRTNHRNGEVFKMFEMTNVKFSKCKNIC